ncbi:ABC transporter permease [Marinagarivorans algicola]|uniref:ABC transporter permease n=1 Tax=Marinagarivorans algicola TaxID=1513270 RepID=UPI0006B5E280|nr:ABC transporter permease [Marinagarivorans algicola]
MRELWVVFKKEWLDTRRDLKGVLPILLMPLLFALTSYGVLNFVVILQQKPAEFTLPVINPQNAAPLIAQLHANGIQTKTFEGDAHQQVRIGKVPMVLHIPEHFERHFNAQRTANIELIWDLSRSEQHATASRVKHIANRWFKTLGAQRLILRGVSPQAVHVGQIIDVNTAQAQQMAMRVLGSVPLFLVLVAFIACAGIATEMAAGEREGRTLETLLLTPVAKPILFAGKWLMACSLSLIVMLMALAGQALAIALAPASALGLRLDLSISDYMIVFILLLPLILMANSLLLFISLRARSLKDSQTYTQLVTLLPTATGLYVLLASQKTTLLIASIPLLGNQALITDALSGIAIAPIHMILNATGCLIIASLLAKGGLMAFKLR